MHLLAATAHWAGLALYGLVLTGFALKALFQPVRRRETLLAFQGWGSFLGLSMGALIFGGVGLHLLQYGLHWPGPEQAYRGWLLAKYTVFAMLWLSSFHLEIWTLEPLRNPQPDAENRGRSIQRIARQLQLNAALFHLVGLLTLLGVH